MGGGLADVAVFGLQPTTAYGLSLLLFVTATFLILPALLLILKHKVQGQGGLWTRPVLVLLLLGALSIGGGVFFQS